MSEFLVKTIDGLVLNINQKDVEKLDIVKNNDDSYHVIYNNKSYAVFLANRDNCDTKHFIVNINDKEIELDIKDSLDQMLEEMGFSDIKKQGSGEIKSPMPGLVLKIEVNEGQQVEKNDTLLTLEAMKMENLIKAPASGIIKSIEVNEGDAVNKNQLLVIIGD